jgi:acyl-CoA synthetase (AMP-forming)/AMP-acid ligase II
MESELEPKTIIDVIFSHADNSPGAPAIEYYNSHLELVTVLTYGELVRRIKIYGNSYSPYLSGGESAMVALPYGVEYVVHLLAVLVVGAVAIPGMPANRRSADRLRSMLDIGRPKLILHNGINSYTAAVLTSFAGVHVNIADICDSGIEYEGELPVSTDSAILQFTSGSTSSPKAVILSHKNIINNQKSIAIQSGHIFPVRLMGWLPLFHDMGLIANVMQPLYMGGTAIMLSPGDVIARPMSWLQLIQKTGAQTSGGPNFIYDLCIRRIDEDQLKTIDLSCWSTAYNGSDLVRRHTLEKFADKFSVTGFRKTALFPCYGLAEATLLVTGQRYFKDCDHTILNVNVDSSGKHVACGPVDEDTKVVVVDSQNMRLVADGIEGDILVSGPSISEGYLTNLGIETVEFNHKIEENMENYYFRTGDRGFIENGMLFVVGRTKDVIKIRGITYHLEDIEATVERECPAFDVHKICAVNLKNSDAEDTVCLIVEIQKPFCPVMQNDLYRQARTALSSQMGLFLSRIVFVPRGVLIRTSSGKFLRSKCRDNLVAGLMPIVQTLTTEK